MSEKITKERIEYIVKILPLIKDVGESWSAWLEVQKQEDLDKDMLDSMAKFAEEFAKLQTEYTKESLMVLVDGMNKMIGAWWVKE